jgi:hypothetical protein
MKTPKKCGRKTCRSRQAPGMIRIGIMQCIIKTKYHVGRGKHLRRFGSGLTDNGRVYYQELLRIFKELKSSDVWNTLQEHWKLYQKNIMPDMIIKLRNQGNLRKNLRQAAQILIFVSFIAQSWLTLGSKNLITEQHEMLDFLKG